MVDIGNIQQFLLCATPEAWLVEAEKNLDVILIDHAHCEKKAASTAMSLLFRYVDRKELLVKLSQLAREELLHFEQVLEFMEQLDVKYDHMTAGRYAKELRQDIRADEPYRLIDTLIVGAIIEARSCERFAALAPRLMESERTAALGRYYVFLLKSESRHYEDYLALAAMYASEDIEGRIALFLGREKELIESIDPQFRFHSGVPA